MQLEYSMANTLVEYWLTFNLLKLDGGYILSGTS